MPQSRKRFAAMSKDDCPGTQALTASILEAKAVRIGLKMREGPVDACLNTQSTEAIAQHIEHRVRHPGTRVDPAPLVGAGEKASLVKPRTKGCAVPTGEKRGGEGLVVVDALAQARPDSRIAEIATSVAGSQESLANPRSLLKKHDTRTLLGGAYGSAQAGGSRPDNRYLWMVCHMPLSRERPSGQIER
jgi:hypothetical protein